MSRRSRYMFFIILVSVFSMFGCSGVSVSGPAASAPVGSYQVVTVSDLHFNPLYDATLFSQLENDPTTAQWVSIFKTSSKTTPSVGGADTNYPLLALTLTSMKQNMSSSPVVLFTGDVLGHNIPQNFCNAYYGSLTPPQSPPSNCATDLNSPSGAAMQQFINNIFTFVATQIRAVVGNVPVIYAPGNIDTYGPGFGPDSNFLSANAGTVYSKLLNSGVNQQAFLNTFTLDGYYAVEPLGAKLLIVGLNTNLFVQTNPFVPSTAPGYAELSWLDSQLSSAQAAGQKVWILMHVPPGANSQGIAQVAAVPSDVDESDVSMMWDAGLQATFLQKLAKYPGVVTLMLAGHTHMDEFRILPTGDVLEQLPGISPCFGNNPAYKVLTVSQSTFTPTDYQSFDYDLATMPAQFGTLYQFSAVYGAQGTLGRSLGQLYPELASDQNKRDAYELLYGSGTESANPVTFAPWNPINDVNWPIFACTIGDANESDYLKCVNTY